MFQLLHLDHIVLRCISLPAMLDFYRQVLGCTLERSVPELGLYQLRAGKQLIDLISVDGKLGQEGGAAPGVEGHNLAHFCLRIAPYDAAALTAFFIEQGIQVSASAVRYGADGFGSSLYIQDPMGNTVELKGPPDMPAVHTQNH
ncbi:VOC family protein [Rheinheimera riviphila]|uniref:VOC family protein n=1 Tax=Rheinheimera riviphila TaxID=1834037 RepID=A0A437R0W8_9GAMM|nr:VOC family protein [Rheinheimera riviphila]